MGGMWLEGEEEDERESWCYNIQVIAVFARVWRRLGTCDKSCGPSPYLSGPVRVPGASATHIPPSHPPSGHLRSRVPSSADQRMFAALLLCFYPSEGASNVAGVRSAPYYRPQPTESIQRYSPPHPGVHSCIASGRHAEGPMRQFGIRPPARHQPSMYITSSSPSSACAPRPSMSGLAHCWWSHASCVCSESQFHSPVHQTPSLRHSRCHPDHLPDRQSPRCPSRKHRLAPWRRGWTLAHRARSSSTRAESRWNCPQAGDCRRLRARAHRSSGKILSAMSHDSTHNEYIAAFHDHIHHPSWDEISIPIKAWCATEVDFDL